VLRPSTPLSGHCYRGHTSWGLFFKRATKLMLWRSSTPARHPPGFVEPCLPTVADSVPSGPQWVHEIKHDGFRFICRREGNRIRVFSRRGNEYTERVPRIVDTVARLPASSLTLDGEGVACDPNGVTNFELLRAALGRPAKREVFLYAFDLLELDGRDMRREPWSDRRWKLARCSVWALRHKMQDRERRDRCGRMR
jgi:bifunctional non-homologous end joining protein LigD